MQNLSTNTEPDPTPSAGIPAVSIGGYANTPIPTPHVRKARLVVVESVYFQGPDGAMPTGDSARFSRWLESDEQPYTRHLKLGEQWVQLDTGWLAEQVGHIRIENREGYFTQTVPTAEQKAEAEAKVVEIGLEIPQDESAYPYKGERIVPLISISPRESERWTPAKGLNLECIYLRSTSGISRCVVNLYPR